MLNQCFSTYPSDAVQQCYHNYEYSNLVNPAQISRVHPSIFINGFHCLLSRVQVTTHTHSSTKAQHSNSDHQQRQLSQFTSPSPVESGSAILTSMPLQDFPMLPSRNSAKVVVVTGPVPSLIPGKKKQYLH